MGRVELEVADVFRRHGAEYRQAHAGTLGRAQLRVMRAIELCRTAALGGHVEQCDACAHRRVFYNSCLMGKFSNGEPAAALPSSMLLVASSALHYRGFPEQGDQLVRWPEGRAIQF